MERAKPDRVLLLLVCSWLALLSACLQTPPDSANGTAAAPEPNEAGADSEPVPAGGRDDGSPARIPAEIETYESELGAREAELDRRERNLDRREEVLRRGLAALDARLAEPSRSDGVGRPASAPSPPAAADSAGAASPGPSPAPAPSSRATAAVPPVAREAAARTGSYRITLPAGTRLSVELQEPLSSRESAPGDAFQAVVRSDVRSEAGEIAVPVGSLVHGRVVTASPLEQGKDAARLHLEFVRLEPVGGRPTAMAANPTDATAAESEVVFRPGTWFELTLARPAYVVRSGDSASGPPGRYR